MSDDRPLDPEDERPVDPDDERRVDPAIDDPATDPTLGDDMRVVTSGTEGGGDLVPDEERPVPMLADEEDDEDESGAAPI